jgi:phosphoesterase RecJ-like protein
MKTGFDANHVHRLIFDNNPLSKIRLMGHVLSQKLVSLPDYRTVYMTISEEEFKTFGSNMGDTDGIVNYGLGIENVVMAVLMIERKDEIKLSFRSVDDFSVRDLAAKYFEGGGHKNASGGRGGKTLEETIKKLLNILPEYKENLLAVVK